jgi:hypothetical protein
MTSGIRRTIQNGILHKEVRIYCPERKKNSTLNLLFSSLQQCQHGNTTEPLNNAQVLRYIEIHVRLFYFNVSVRSAVSSPLTAIRVTNELLGLCI